MNMREELLKPLFEKILGTPRLIQKTVRVVPEAGNDVIERETTLTGLHDGVLKTVEEKQLIIPSCSHLEKPVAVCCFVDELLPGPHMSCPACSFICAGCQVAGCARHLGLVDGQRLCADCARKAALDAIAQRILSGFLGVFE